MGSLDVTQNPNLKKLAFSNTKVSTIDLSNNQNLVALSYSNTPMGNFDISGFSNLEYFDCGKTNTTSVNVSSNPALRVLECGNNNLSSLDVSSNSNLQILECGNANLKELDVNNNTKLKVLNCSGNKLTSIDLSRNGRLVESDSDVDQYFLTFVHETNIGDQKTSAVANYNGRTVKVDISDRFGITESKIADITATNSGKIYEDTVYFDTPLAGNSASISYNYKTGNTTFPDMGVKISVSAEAAVATQSLPDGKTGTAYSFTLEGTSPGTWSVSSGNLPDGLTLDSDTGEISGTPTKDGTFNFTVKFENSNGSATQDLSIEVTPGIDTDALADLPNGKVGDTYEGTLKTSGTTTAGTWSVGGDLPPGLTLDSTTGKITGTPTRDGKYDFTVTFTNSNESDTQDASITIEPSISTTEIPDGKAGESYEATLETPDGVTDGTWSISSGELPDGLTLDSHTGKITGTPEKEGTSTFTVKFENSIGSDTQEFTLKIAPVITTDTKLPDGSTGEAYDQTLKTPDGTASGTWKVTEGNLPPGLSLDENTGEISGTPTKDGDFEFKVTFENDNGSDTHDFTIHIDPSIATDSTLPNGTAGSKYDQTLKTPDGTAEGTWKVTDGNLPPGLSLDEDTGKISGTPKKPGTYEFTITFTNENGSVSKDFTLVIDKSSELDLVNLVVKARGDKSASLKWNKVKGATEYEIYFAKCNTDKTYKFKKIKTVKNKTSFTKKGLKKGVFYKYYVKAIKRGQSGDTGQVPQITSVVKSIVSHSIAGDYSKNFTNAKSVKVSKKTVKMKVGKALRISGDTTKVKKSRKLPRKKHAKHYRYISNNPGIATVNARGLIKGRSIGKCKIYVYAQNGVYDVVNVTVK